LLLAQTVRVPAEGVDAFRQFEATVLPLLPEHGGVLERRLRSLEGCTAIHIVRSTSREASDGYRTGPRRQAHLHLLHESRAVPALLEVVDVTAVLEGGGRP
jgi:hypothetical protein